MFVIECFVPDVARFDHDQRVQARSHATPDGTGIGSLLPVAATSPSTSEPDQPTRPANSTRHERVREVRASMHIHTARAQCRVARDSHKQQPLHLTGLATSEQLAEQRLYLVDVVGGDLHPVLAAPDAQDELRSP